MLALFLALPVQASGPMVAIDVGHSLQQPGATSARGKDEFQFNRDLAQIILHNIVAMGGHGFEIGADGNSVDPETRPVEASMHNAKFFLSIHHDSVQPQYLEDWNWEGGVQRVSPGFHCSYRTRTSNCRRACNAPRPSAGN